MVSLFKMSKSVNYFVKAYCKDGEIVTGVVAAYTRPEDNPKERTGVIEVDKKSHYIVLKQYELDKLEVYDASGRMVNTEPTAFDKFKYFMLGRDINK